MGIWDPIARSLAPQFRALVRDLKRLRKLCLKQVDIERTFNEIIENNKWGSRTTISGPGSEFKETEEVRALLPNLISNLGVRSLLDAPCGDFYWMKNVDLDGCYYFGTDIVKSVIDANQKRYGNEKRNFFHADLTKDFLPQVDLILCRDCLIHLSFGDAKKAVCNFIRSKAKYLLVTTNPEVKENIPIRTGDFRNLNLRLKPFRFPEPLAIYRDRYAGNGGLLIDPHKSLGLWRLSDLESIMR